jgi:hypothetical protein
MKNPLIAVMQNDHKHWQGDHQQALEDLERNGRTIEDYGDTPEAHYVEKTKSHKGAIENTDVVATTFRVRYAETDQMGIVHHSSYVVWLEEGRSQWMRAHRQSAPAVFKDSELNRKI